MLFRHELINESLVYLPYIRYWETCVTESMSLAARRAWHDSQVVITRTKYSVEHTITHNWNLRRIMSPHLHNEYGPAVIKYYRTGQIAYEGYYANGDLNSHMSPAGLQLPAKIRYYKSGQISRKEYHVDENEYCGGSLCGTGGSLYNGDDPVVIRYYKNGQVSSETRREYYLLGDDDRPKNNPTLVRYYRNGQVSTKIYKSCKTTYHCEGGPAVVRYLRSGQLELEKYYIKGKQHRADGPAEIRYYENGRVSRAYYYIDDKRHRTDGPAVIWYYSNGQLAKEEYRIYDMLYRFDGPNIIEYYETGHVRRETYHDINGKRHREIARPRHRLDVQMPRQSLPAEICYYANGQIEKEIYWVHGEYRDESRRPCIIEYCKNGQLNRLGYRPLRLDPYDDDGTYENDGASSIRSTRNMLYSV